MPDVDCNLIAQEYAQGACSVEREGRSLPACQVTLRKRDGRLERLITSIHLSRPENYLSIYQSGCNMTCRKCHSWEFSQHAKGSWMSAEAIVLQAVAYKKLVTLQEPRERATSWHAHDTCRCCGSCITRGERGESCPGKVEPEQMLMSPQGFGPARNIAAFTGGDLTCRPEFYARCARGIKESTDLWVLIETNGYGLTSQNLDILKDAGVDAFWLDIKAFDPARHKWLTGCDNRQILSLPNEMVSRGFVLEVLSLYIPGVVEAGELGQIAGLLAKTDPRVPFTILAFFPEYLMKDTRRPLVQEMIEAYTLARHGGLENVRLGNLGVFVKTQEDVDLITAELGTDAF